MASRALFSFTWIASCLPVAFWIALVQPWPLTLRNGPDTNYAQQGFAKRIGFAPPDSVSNIYYRADEGWMDSGYRLRFNCNDESLVKQIVARLQLKETRNPVMGALSKSPKWWAEIEQRQNLRHYTRKRPGAYYWYLWYDPVTGTVWYEEFSV